MDSSPSSPIISRRRLIRHGARLACVVPTVIIAMPLHEAYAQPKDKKDKKGKDGSPF